jgi:repressor LexA
MPKPRLFSKMTVLQVINDWMVEHGMPPTILELQKALGVGSVRTVLRYLDELEEGGDIDRWGGARGIRLLRRPHDQSTVAIPVVGDVPAGPLMTAEQNVEAWIRMPMATLASRAARHFFLRVRGDSMNRCDIKGRFIEDGDLVLVRQAATADSGQIVVALIDGEATIKRFIRGDGYYYLKPESSNKTHHPIMLDERFTIQGVVEQIIKRGSALFEE